MKCDKRCIDNCMKFAAREIHGREQNETTGAVYVQHTEETGLWRR